MKTENTPLKIGDRIRITEDIVMFNATYHKGHEFKIVYSGPRGFDIEDDEGDRLIECMFIQKYFERI